MAGRINSNKIFQWLHRESNPRLSGLYHSALAVWRTSKRWEIIYTSLNCDDNDDDDDDDNVDDEDSFLNEMQHTIS